MEKMHIKGSLAKQQEDSREMLDRLVADSQLLSRYPVAKEPSKPRIEFEDDLDDRASIRDQVKPFIYAADSAKLATLVEVAENVEVGMESVEEARKYLEQVCKLLNVPFQQVVDEATQKDVANNPESSPSPGKERAPKRDDDGSIKSIWDILDGNLGSINEY